MSDLPYPAARKENVFDVIHGVRVDDPYRWLEDPDSRESGAWVEAETKVTEAFLAGVPRRDAIRERLTELWDYERFGIPDKEGGRYFFRRNDGLQNQSVLYVLDDLSGEPRMLLDPNALSEDGTVALSGWSADHKGRLLAYGVSIAGSDWQEWKVRDVATGADRADHLRWVKFSGADWDHEGTGFYYSRYDEPDEGESLVGVNYYQKLYHHRVGTPQSEDRLVYERPDHKDWGFGGSVTEDGRYLIIGVWRGTDRRNGVFYRDLSDPDAPVVELLEDFDADYSFVANGGPIFRFRTDLDAPRGRLVEIDVRHPERDNWKTLVAETDDTLVSVRFVGERFVCRYLQDAKSVVKVHGADGAYLRDVELPGLGTASGFGGRGDDPETFFSFTSNTTPDTIYRYDVRSGSQSVFRRPKVDFDPDRYETRQVFFRSKDGVRIPMFITHRKGLVLDGNNPTYLYGYGGFNISITPSFSVRPLVWMEMGGVLAVPNLRGGGEYGEEWHQAGMKLAKQNVFDDFIAAAEWLIEQRYTSSRRLAIAGGSNGGLLVGACMTQRPELFGACLPAVGVLDMLRFHKFTIGWAWVVEYGSVDDPEEFKALLAYSPLQNVKPGIAYPATLISTADHDDRVVPAHSFKFAATLQAAQAGHAPILIRIETRAGHGAGKPTAKLIDEAADKWAFLVRVLDMKPPKKLRDGANR